ncbi:DNA repair protein RecO [Candidatus Izimaplasma bacterium ZiA1]|uniref:DNA repair protein RecO n=1 Tax=Candidatus Izimoplasma sp. ZiA1 TaxID=2024899 RepID=UPI000BAA5393|nr:DNA repair protein RecO [Candidatus Izimaplasma bacterium ZiA1]
MDNEGIVLRSLDYKDSSKILYLYTNTGNISIIAHSVKKYNSKNRFLSQSCNLIKFSKTNKSFPSLKEAELLNSYDNIKNDIISFSYVNHIFELVSNVISEDLNHQKMLNFIKKILLMVNQNYDPEVLTFIFELKLLYFIGYGLNFTKCPNCNEEEDIVFNINAGGVICRKHILNNDIVYEENITKLIKYLYYIDVNKNDIINISTEDKFCVRKVINELYSQYISYNSKSLKIIEQLKTTNFR